MKTTPVTNVNGKNTIIQKIADKPVNKKVVLEPSVQFLIAQGMSEAQARKVLGSPP
jgi:hypothetical protein